MCYLETKQFYAGEGNQLFVYCYGMIISHKFNIPYIHPGIPSLQIPSTVQLRPSNQKSWISITNYQETLQITQLSTEVNYLLDYGFNPTIEDYTLFLPYVSFLKQLFPKQEILYKKELVYHLRAGDTLLCKGRNYKYLQADKLEQLLSSISHTQLYVVTNLVKQDLWTMDDLYAYRKKLLEKGDCGANYTESLLINEEEMKESLRNLNNVLTVLKQQNAIWKSDTIWNDFNTIRSFQTIIMNVSTFSWWAAVLSDATKVYTPKHWKYLKGNRNKNLPYMKLPGWEAVDL